MVPAAEPMPATPNGAKSLRWLASKAVNAMITNIASTPSLITTMIALTVADSLAPRISSSAHIAIRTIAGRFTIARLGVPRRRRQRMRHLEPEQIVQQLVQVAAPADRDRGGGHAVFQQQAGRHTHRDRLTQRGVRVRVRRARNRHGGGQFGVADSREPGRDAGDEEGDDHAGAGLRDRQRQHEEDAGADRRADPEHGQLERADTAFELVGRPIGDGRAGHRAAPQHLLCQADR